MAQPPKKKAKTGSTQQTFKSTYTEEWPFIIESSLDSLHAFCTTCSTDFSISHSGRYDCKTHIGSAKHKKLTEAKGSSNIASMFKTMSSSAATSASSSLIKAEAMMAEFIAKHNLSLSVANDLPSLLKDIIDTGMASKIRCGRTKTTSLINEMSAITQDNIIDRMRNGPFTISTDGSNDMGCAKLFPLVVRTISDSGVTSEVVSVPQCEGSSTGEQIFVLIDSFFQKNNIPWTNCIALGCDNANVMTGGKKGVFAFCKEKNPDIQLAGCPLHLVHIAASKGANMLPVSANDLLTDVFLYFHRSSVRSHRFKLFQELYGDDQSKILKYGPTRWLSIGKCLDRLLRNWKPLKEFFRSELKEQELGPFAKGKCEKILDCLRSRSKRLHLLFLRYAIKPMEQYLTKNQADAPKAATIIHDSRCLIRDMMSRFVRPSAFAGNKCVEDVQYDLQYNIKPDKDLLIGEECLSFIERKDNGFVGADNKKLKDFYDSVKSFYKTVVAYFLKSLPISDKVLRSLYISDPQKMATGSSSDVRFLSSKFPILIKKGSSLDAVQEQFAKLQSSVPDDTSHLVDECRVDEFWAKLLRQKEFSDVAFFMLGLLTIPHSSAHCERVFSAVRKIKTDQRSLLGPKSLESLLVVKHRQPSSFDVKNMSCEEMKRLKGACTAANSSEN